jgi:hypothetical protein
MKNRFILDSDDLELLEYKELVIPKNKKKNANDAEKNVLKIQQSSLENQVINIQGQTSGIVLNNVQKTNNGFDEQIDIISETEKSELQHGLELALIAYLSAVIPLFAVNTMNQRQKEYGLIGTYKLDNMSKEYINMISTKSSESHMNTILNDLFDSIKETYTKEVDKKLKIVEDTGRKVTDEDLVNARKLANEGASKQEIIRAVKEEYAGHISKARAKAIATTETNRAFTQSQFQADRQFLQQNNLTDRAYKKWVTTNDNPCATCLDMASRPPIPFEKNFANLGDEIVTVYEDDNKVKTKRVIIDFEPLSAGNAHVNCGCKYELIVK